jgi:NNP family nitrate/nitrite transporter-like MFS transporter
MPTQPDQDNAALPLVVPLPLVWAGFVVASGCWTLFVTYMVQLSPAGLLLVMPMAATALLTVPLRRAAGRWGSRRLMLLCLAGLASAMVVLWWAKSVIGYLMVATGLGLAGGCYAASLRFVVTRAPAGHWGLALAMFGAGTVGVAFNQALVSVLEAAFSWRAVPVAYLIILLLMIVLTWVLTDPDAGSFSTPG